MKKFMFLIVIAILTFSLVACGSNEKNEASSSTESTNNEAQESNETISEATNNELDKIKEKGELVVATSPDYPPYEFKIIEDGKEKVVGFDMEIAKEIAKDIGVELRISEMEFNGLLLALNADKADIIMAGMTPDEERSKAVNFSEIYYLAEQGIMISSDDKDTLNTLESFSGKKVGVQKGSVQEKIAMEQMPDAKIISLAKLPNIILELKSGNIDAAIVELPVANGYIKKYPELTLSNAKVKDEAGGSAIAIKKGNDALTEQVNATIKRLQEDGSIDKFVVEANEIVEGLAD